jgi:N-acetyl sugar amidotransferase
MVSDDYRRCARCVMDTDEPGISFNAAGQCNYCTEGLERLQHGLLPLEDRDRALQALIRKVKEHGKDKPYDCVIGLSGGADSTTVAYVVSKLGLRPYAVHLDNGWNSPEAEHNIRMTAERLGIDVHTYVVDPQEFIDLQRSYLRASVGNLEAPTDHAISALLFKAAAKHGIKFILTGSNLVTESILSRGWGHFNQDLRNLKAIHRRFGTVPLRTLPVAGLIERTAYIYCLRIRWIPFLNYIDYDKEQYKKLLAAELDWRDYGGKHYESTWTKFFQAYILPTKFGVDKRKSHLSSMICSGKLDRDSALAELAKPLYEPDEFERDLGIVLERLKLSREEFKEIMAQPPKNHTDYPSNAFVISTLGFLARRFRKRAITP